MLVNLACVGGDKRRVIYSIPGSFFWFVFLSHKKMNVWMMKGCFKPDVIVLQLKLYLAQKATAIENLTLDQTMWVL